MNEATYMNTQAQIILLTDVVKRLPLKEFIEAGERANAVGPYFDPTLWHVANKNLMVIVGLARSLEKFQVEAQKLIPDLPGTLPFDVAAERYFTPPEKEA